jgi:maleylacetate reductase
MIAGTKLHFQQERIIYGRPAADVIAEEADRLDAHRVFLVCSRHLADENGPTAVIAKALGTRHAGTYGNAQSHTPKEVVVEAANQARDARADLLISIGGGSVTDTVKIMQRCLWHDFTTVEELVPNRMFGVHQVPGMDPSRHPPGMDDAIRMIAVPATYSAAEFNFGGSTLNLKTRAKEAHAHPLMIPRTVVLDPEVTLFTSLDQLLASGIYLVDHFIADFMSPKADLVSRMMIGEGIRHLPEALRAIKNNPDDLEPRLYGLLCAWWARDPDLNGVFQGLGHAIGLVFGERYRIPPGVTSAALQPAALRWNLPASAAQQQELAARMGRPGRPLADVVAELIADLGLRSRLRDIGVDRSDFPAIAERTMKNALLASNPRKVTGTADVLEVLEAAW